VRLPGEDLGDGGFLEVETWDIHGEPVELSVWLPGRLVRTLAALAAARREDERHGVSEEAAGWRRADKLAAWIGQYTGWPLENQAIHAYICQIYKKLRTEARRKYADVPVLIERRRGRGARLAAGVVDLLDSLIPQTPGPY
jgi:hypothetical protein